MATATLVAHVDANMVTRAQLAGFPTPAATKTFLPVSHVELVETIEKSLKMRGIVIRQEQFAVRADGSRLFGTLDLDMDGVAGSSASMGFRTSNDKSLSIQIVAGLRVFVCDNLVLNGDFIALKRKHTSGLNLREEIMAAVEKYIIHFGTLKGEVTKLQQKNISDVEAKAFMHDLFVKRVMPVRYFPQVSEAYFNPPYDDFSPRTAWSLHNAFTEVAKVLPLNTRMEATQLVGREFGLLSQQN
jgi:hypothetical protein